MMKIKFKNLEKSEMARDATKVRMATLIEKFPDLANANILITLTMDNSPSQAGPDLFKVKVHISSGKYKSVIVEKESSNLYAALASVIEHMLEKLNRFGDKQRVKQIKVARQMSRKQNPEIDLPKV